MSEQDSGKATLGAPFANESKWSLTPFTLRASAARACAPTPTGSRRARRPPHHCYGTYRNRPVFAAQALARRERPGQPMRLGFAYRLLSIRRGSASMRARRAVGKPYHRISSGRSRPREGVSTKRTTLGDRPLESCSARGQLRIRNCAARGRARAPSHRLRGISRTRLFARRDEDRAHAHFATVDVSPRLCLPSGTGSASCRASPAQFRKPRSIRSLHCKSLRSRCRCEAAPHALSRRASHSGKPGA